MRKIRLCVFYAIVVQILLLMNISWAQKVSEYLVLQDIGDYKFITQSKDFITGEVKTIPGYIVRTAPGILAAADHFDLDHDDKTYETDYVNVNIELAVDVQITQHAGSESDKWLLHEVDMFFRNYYGIPGRSYIVRNINGNKVITYAAGGWAYRWLSDNKVIQIEYTDLQMTKPEPIDVVKAYLAKHPSTLPSTITAKYQRSEDGLTKWIKDEMERRLWLCDRWFLALQTGKAKEKTVYRNAVDSMQVFLDYREKYYGISAKSEKQVLWEYLQANNGTGIKDKLQKYKSWWSGNRDKAISIQ